MTPSTVTLPTVTFPTVTPAAGVSLCTVTPHTVTVAAVRYRSNHYPTPTGRELGQFRELDAGPASSPRYQVAPIIIASLRASYAASRYPLYRFPGDGCPTLPQKSDTPLRNLIVSFQLLAYPPLKNLIPSYQIPHTYTVEKAGPRPAIPPLVGADRHPLTTRLARL